MPFFVIAMLFMEQDRNFTSQNGHKKAVGWENLYLRVVIRAENCRIAALYTASVAVPAKLNSIFTAIDAEQNRVLLSPYSDNCSSDGNRLYFNCDCCSIGAVILHSALRSSRYMRSYTAYDLQFL